MFGDTPLHYIDTPEKLAEAAERLSRAAAVGVDTESDSFHHYQEKVCLLQLSDLENDYIVDPLAVRDLSPLAAMFADPGVVKVFHGADYDVVSLKRDFGFTFRTLFDTMLAAQFLGLPRVGLADLIERWFGWEIDKKWQRHDWAERPLLEEHLDYARGDTHFLLALREIMTRKLVAADRLHRLEEECRLVESRAWAGRTADPADFLRVKGSRALDDLSKRVLRSLYRYRDSQGRALDRPVFKVIPDPVLVEIARAQPTDHDALARVIRKGSPLMRRFGDGLIQAVLAGLDDETPLPEPAARAEAPRVPDVLRGRDQEILLQLLKDWRNAIVERDRIAPVAVVSNGVLRDIARLAPRTHEELAAVPDIRHWQVHAWGDALIALVESVLATRSEDAGGKRRRRRRRKPDGE